MKQYPHGSLGGQATREKQASGGRLLQELLDRYGGGANRLLRLRNLDFTRPQVIFWAIFALMASSLLISVWTRRNDQTVNRSFGAADVGSPPPTINNFQPEGVAPQSEAASFGPAPPVSQYPPQPKAQQFRAPAYQPPGVVEHHYAHAYQSTAPAQPYETPAMPTYATPMYGDPTSQSYVVPNQEANGQRVKTVVSR